MNQLKKIFLFSALLLQSRWSQNSTPQPAPTFNLQPIQSLISSANSNVSNFMAWNEPAEGQAAVDSLVQLIQGLYQIINLENPALGSALALLDPVFAQGATYITSQDLNISGGSSSAPTVIIPQAVYTSMNAPLGTVMATTYPLTTIATNIVETATKMVAINTWNNQLNLLTENQLNSGIYFVMSVNSSTNIISCYVFASDKQTQIGQTFTVPLTCALNELTVTYNSQTTTISSDLSSNFSIFITSDYVKTIPSSVLASMNSPATISGTFDAPLLQAELQAQQANINNAVLDMGPFTSSSPLNTIPSQYWVSGIYITMFANSTNSSVVYDFWASDKTTHLGSVSQSLPSITGLIGSMFTYECSFSGSTATATITPTKALLIKASKTPETLFSSYISSSKTYTATIAKSDLESLQIVFNAGGYRPQAYSAYSQSGISGQLLQNTEIDLSAGVYIVPTLSSSSSCNLIPCVVFFDSNKNFLGIQGLTGGNCPESGWTGFSLKTANTPQTQGAPFGMSFLLKITP